MAMYKYQRFLTPNQEGAFDGMHGPGQPTPVSGIYRCTGCGHEVTSVFGKTMPPQDHHTHTWQQGAIAWQLIVATTHRN
jgi:hypothetical protein